MKTYKGKSVYKGIAMGNVIVLKDRDLQVKRYRIEDADAEIARPESIRPGKKRRSSRNGMIRR